MSRIPGTYEKGDRVRIRGYHNGYNTEGTVHEDNRKMGGRNVWVEWDTEPGELVCCTPDTFISVEAGK